MPSHKTVLKSGDIVSIDTGVELNGYFGDSAITIPVGEPRREVRKLLDSRPEESLELAIDKVQAGQSAVRCLRHRRAACGVERVFRRSGVWSATVSGLRCTKSRRFRITSTGRNENPRLKEGMVPRHRADGECREAGDSKVLPDRWTAVTKDGSYSAHFEHCVAVTANGPWVLTRP